MNEYLTPIGVVVALAGGGLIATLLIAAIKRKKREEAERERKRMEERVRLRLAAERERWPAGRVRAPKDPIRRINVPRSAVTGRYKVPGKRPLSPARISAPAPERRSDYDMTTPLLMGLLFDAANNSSNDSSRNDSPSYDPSPSPSPSYDSGSSSSSYDSGSSSSFDSGGSFSGGDSGSF